MARANERKSAGRANRTSAVELDRSLVEAVDGLTRLAASFERRRQQLSRALGLSDAQLRVLEEIAHDDFMPSLFARRRACSPAAVSRTLRQVQEAGWVRAAIGAGDARQRAYRLTPAGRRLVERLRSERLAALEAIWVDLPGSELARFGAFSRELAARLDAYADRRARQRPAAKAAARRR